MDFRTPRSADRTALNRPRPVQQQPEEPQPVKEVPRTVQRTAALTQAPKHKKSSKRLMLLIIAVIIVAIVCVAGWFVWSNTRNVATTIDSAKYQAVFFTNGQIYFGKLHMFNDEYMKLSDIYYLQPQSSGETDSDNPQKTTTDQNNVQLIKLGDEIHGPQDEMIISKDQVLFYENLKSDGKVSQSIDKFKKSH